MSQIAISDIQGVRLIQATHSSDLRGQFIKYRPNDFLKSESGSLAISTNPKAGTIRGLHFQVEPFAEEKIITCVQGSIFDVVIDIRPKSKSFGKIATMTLQHDDALHVYLPKGLAHGFQTLEINTIVHYFISAEYSPEHAYAINPLGNLGIVWPLKEFLVSDRDSNGISLLEAQRRYSESIQI